MCTRGFGCAHPRMWHVSDPHTHTLVQFHPQPNSTPVLWRISVTDTRAHPPPTGHPSTGVNLHPWVWVYTHGSPPDLPKTSLGTHVGDRIPSHGLCNTPCICPNMVYEVYMVCRWVSHTPNVSVRRILCPGSGKNSNIWPKTDPSVRLGAGGGEVRLGGGCGRVIRGYP